VKTTKASSESSESQLFPPKAKKLAKKSKKHLQYMRLSCIVFIVAVGNSRDEQDK
jgi:hypothetical protein